MWDLGGSEQMQDLWTNYIPFVDCLIFIVDCNDKLEKSFDSFSMAVKILTISSKSFPKPILILINNKFNSIDPKLVQKVSLWCNEIDCMEFYRNNFKHYTMVINALNGDGILESLNWIEKSIG